MERRLSYVPPPFDVPPSKPTSPRVSVIPPSLQAHINDVETNAPKLKYPFSVFFIIVNEFCERFSYYGMRTVLALYFTTILHFDANLATVLYHTFICLCYFTPIMGAVLADNYLGKFRTIFYLSILYAAGSIILSVASIPATIPQVPFSMVGLFLIAVGTGGIKPCVSAFGGDQFVRPEQEKQLEQFFSVFYFAINSGSLISTFLTPILREDVKCFDQDTCFSLAFGLPACLMIVSVCIFVSGKRTYKIKEPEGNIMGSFIKCIWYALKRKMTSKGEKHSHWLEFASDKYDAQLIDDIKRVLRVGLVFLPLPVFWALYDQQGSRWTFQATRMNGALGSFVIKPDQMQIANPLLILMLVPLFESVIYPLLNKCFNFTPLRRIGCGLFLCGLSFVASGVLELQLEPTYERMAADGYTQFNFINTLPCDVILKYTPKDQSEINVTIPHNSHLSLYDMDQSNSYDATIRYTDVPVCGKYKFTSDTTYWSGLIEGQSVQGYSVLITVRDSAADPTAAQLTLTRTLEEAPYRKSVSGRPIVGLLFDDLNSEPRTENLVISLTGSHNYNILVKGSHKNTTTPDIGNVLISDQAQEVEYGTYDIHLHDYDKVQLLGQITTAAGGCYLGVIQRPKKDPVNPQSDTILFDEVTPANSIHMLWLIPQYFIVTVAEVMFSVTGLTFSFTQAPDSMRSIMQAMWCLIVAFGNVIVIIVAEVNGIPRMSDEFFVFAGIMGAATIVFTLLAMTYTYHEEEEEEEEAKEEQPAIKMDPMLELSKKLAISRHSLSPEITSPKNSISGVATPKFTSPRSSLTNAAVANFISPKNSLSTVGESIASDSSDNNNTEDSLPSSQSLKNSATDTEEPVAVESIAEQSVPAPEESVAVHSLPAPEESVALYSVPAPEESVALYSVPAPEESVAVHSVVVHSVSE